MAAFQIYDHVKLEFLRATNDSILRREQAMKYSSSQFCV